ncbi:hypothetical protein Tco_1091607 [Tanacetum coccineum]|uniref:Reverse transcriptase domain-containing protein n=1 Tax=Tanacetum coccineum TaxID=301880 RepID=A0ABQ5I8Q3_9ASTR
MSSPDHPTANLEDAFSSNFPNYVPPASPDYVPASPGKTYSSASNLFGIAPPTLSLFPDDPYMKAWKLYKLSIMKNHKSRLQLSYLLNLKNSFFQKDFFHQQNHLLLPRSNLKLLRLAKALKSQLSSNASKKSINNGKALIRKMEEELYNLSVKGNDLKPYVRRFQELTVLCPNMVPNTDKLLEAFIGGLPRSIEGNVTASKPQTLEESINIA